MHPMGIIIHTTISPSGNNRPKLPVGRLMDHFITGPVFATSFSNKIIMKKQHSLMIALVAVFTLTMSYTTKAQNKVWSIGPEAGLSISKYGKDANANDFKPGASFCSIKRALPSDRPTQSKRSTTLKFPSLAGISSIRKAISDRIFSSALHSHS